MNIILIDDEPLICEYIKECITQCDSVHQVIGCFNRAADALAFLQTHTVHLVITDITMPEMDGLDLAAAIQNQFGDTIDVVMLTCHRNFDFARKAMESSVKSYIIKSEINPGKIKELLDNIEISRTTAPSLKRLSIHYAQSQFLCSFLNDSVKYIISPEELKEYNIAFTGKPFFSLAFPKGKNIIDKLSSYRDSRLIHPIIFFNDATAHYIYTANINASINDTDEITDCIFMLKSYISQLYRYYFGISSVYYKFSSFKKSLLEAEYNAATAFYGFVPKTLPHEQKSLVVIQQEMFSLANKAVSAVLNNLSSDYSVFIDSLFSYANVKERVSPDYLCSLLSYIIVSALPIEKQDSKQTYINSLKEASSFKELKHNFLEFSKIICRSQKAYSVPIEQAIKYINKNYRENFSLADISSHVFLNKDYFCRKFKNEVGSSFTEYRLYVQLREAFNFIVNTDLPINTIAENVGLPNISYFSSAFKKQFGESPSTIRKQYRKTTGFGK